ncbi:MarR family winged helix-turn-helix transcriptional regulator [Furfurilactobacillus cerevisiae]|uniref:MarR family winged helix-turn-helix transcriptional regulator n=1 Tax=Furfurilactobacillus rossiae TaxID=231049 RepID=UPI003B97D012
MADESRDLLNHFGALMQNRLFMMAVLHQRDIASRRELSEGRGQLRLLQLLYQTPAGLTNAEIAQLLDIRPSSVSAMVNRLEAVNMVERVPSEADKRTVIIKLTQAGMDKFSQQDNQVDEMAAQVFGSLTAEEQTELNRLLDKLNKGTADLDWHDFMGGEQGWPHHHGFSQRWF